MGQVNHTQHEYPMVRITWLDTIALLEGWRTIEYYKARAKELALVEHSTVGHLIEDNKDYVIVGLNIRMDGAMMNAFTIARCSIIKIWYLKHGNLIYGGDWLMGFINHWDHWSPNSKPRMSGCGNTTMQVKL